MNHKNELNVSRENKGHYFLLTISSVIVIKKISQKVETWINQRVAVPFPPLSTATRRLNMDEPILKKLVADDGLN